MKISTTLLSATIIASLLTPSLALAQTPFEALLPSPFSSPEVLGSSDSTFAITAVPPRLEVNVKPGETIQKTIKLKNGTKNQLFIDTAALDFIIQNDGSTPIPVDEKISERFSLASWLTLSPAKFSIGPAETQVIDVLISVPADALPGGHYAMLMHQPASDSLSSGGSLTSVSPSTGTLLYVTVAGTIHEEAFIRSFTAPRFVENGPVAFSYSVENRSDIHLRPASSIEVYDLFGQKIDEVIVEQKNIFPGSSRTYSASYGRYWGFGPYTARLKVPFGQSGQLVTASLVFWIFPYRLVLSILLVTSSLIAIFVAIRRHLLHRNDQASQEIELLRQKIKNLEEQHKES